MIVVTLNDNKKTLCFPIEQLIDVRLTGKEIQLVRHDYKNSDIGFDVDTFTYKNKKEATEKFQSFVTRLKVTSN